MPASGVSIAVRVAAGLACLLLVLCPLLPAQAQAQAQENPLVRVAVEGAYPPFNYFDQNNELQGFEVDLLKALCEAMQARCQLVPHEWDGLIRGLINRDYDAIMSSLEITPKRAKRIAFSRPYYRIPAAFIGPKDTEIRAITAEALAGKTIGVEHEGEFAAYVRKLAPEAEVRAFGKLEEANLDLLTGRLDLVLGDKLALHKFLESREGACCRLIADAPYDPAFHSHGYGIGLRREDQDLKARFDDAIRRVMEDGTYDRIRARYFPFDIK